MEERCIRGNIYAKGDKYEPLGEAYIIRCPVTGHGWGLPIRNITPDDLRALADHIERQEVLQEVRKMKEWAMSQSERKARLIERVNFLEEIEQKGLPK